MTALARAGKSGLLPLLVTIVYASAPASSGVNMKYFRSDHGVAAAAGPLPDKLGEPQALRWRMAIGSGHSTPVLVGGKLILTSFDDGSRELATVALDDQTGQLLWKRSVTAPRIEQTHAIGSPATPTPAYDGDRLFVFFGSYGLLCYDLDGTKLWENRLGPFQDEYGAGSSPVLVDNKVILNQDHDVDSFLAAYNRATGKLVWRTQRPDAVRSYSTPALWKRDDRQQLLVAGALELAAYDPANGERLWWIQGLARIVIPIPVPAGELVYMASWAPGGDTGRRIALDSWPAAAGKWDANDDARLSRAEVNDHEVLDRFYRMDLDQDGLLNEKEWGRHADVFRRAQNAILALKPTARGEQSEGIVVWKHLRGVPYVATPLIDKGMVWMVKDGGIVTQLDGATGRVLQEERLPGIGNYFASPVTGDGKVYFASEQGMVSVVANSPEWKLISSHPFNERIYATPVLDGNRLFIRTGNAVYCFVGRAK